MQKKFLALTLIAIISNIDIKTMELTQSKPERTAPTLKTITEKYLINHKNNHPCTHMDELLVHPDLCEDLQNDLKKQFLTKYAIHGIHKGFNSTKIHDKRVEKSIVSVNGDSVYFIANENNKVIFERDTTTNTILGKIEGHELCINDLIKHKEILISGSSDNTIKLWNPNTYKCLQTLNNENDIEALASENTNIICSLSKDDIKIWDISTSQCINEQWITIKENSGCILNNEILYACDNYNNLIQYDLRTKSITTFKEINSLAGLACPSNLSLFSGSYKGGVREWDMRNPNEPVQIFYKNKPTTTIKIHDNILFIALLAPFSFGGRQGSRLHDHPGIKIWDLKKHEELGTLPGDGYIFNLETHDSGVYVSSTKNLMKHSANSYNNAYEVLQNIDFTTTNTNHPISSKDISANNNECSIS